MYTEYLTASVEQHAHCASTPDAPRVEEVEDQFATAPMIVVGSAFQQPNEEELHTSFEQAISERLLAVNRQLSLRSGQLVHAQQSQLTTEPLAPPEPMSSSGLPVMPTKNKRSLPTHPASFAQRWQRTIILGSLVLILLMAGFDLMGLLMLHAL